MKISLRKANAIQISINEAIGNIKILTRVGINEFQNPAEYLTTTNKQLFENDARRQKLLLALYNIRGLVAVANTESGIDLELTKAAFLDRRIQQLQDFARLEPHLELSVIEGRLEKIRTQVDNTMYRHDTVETTVVSQDQIDQAVKEIASLKKQKQKIVDHVLELNIKTEVPLSEDVVEILLKENIL
jgi:hypothetical protein